MANNNSPDKDRPDPVDLEAFLAVHNMFLRLLLSYLELEHPVSEDDAEDLAERVFNHLHGEGPERPQGEVGEEAWASAYKSRALAWEGARLDVLRMIGDQVRTLIIEEDPTLRTWQYHVEGGPDLEGPDVR